MFNIFIFKRNDFDVETISSVAAGLQPSNDDIPDVKKVIIKKVINTFYNVLSIMLYNMIIFLFSVQIAIEMHLLNVRYVAVLHIVLHFVKVKTGAIIKWNVITRKEALCLLFKLKNDPL